MRRTTLILTVLLSSYVFSCSSLFQEMEDKGSPPSPSFQTSIPTAGNSWVLNNGSYVPSEMVTPEGIRNWSDPDHSIRTFFYITEPGKVSIGIRAKVNGGPSKIKVTFRNESKTISLEGRDYNDTYIGDFQLRTAGYYFVDIEGLEKESAFFADVNDLLLGGLNTTAVKFIKDDFYFGRRGPSVHLRFNIPNDVNEIEWFYSELVIPEGQDVIGSYFMANGFGEGYFGIQVNSPTERRVLFSIWSPYQTDNPNDIPEEYKIKLLKKGAGVTTGEFGNEGSGGQSYQVFNWKSGLRYRFLTGAQPTGDGSTDYVAYFYDPEAKAWNLLAQFRRPKTTTYLTNLYSFLENFIPFQGVFARKGLYENQWVYDGTAWHELNEVTFTFDNTARKEYRLDYSGGVENNGFYLKNCGFSNDQVEGNSLFKRKKLNSPPRIDFNSLE